MGKSRTILLVCAVLASLDRPVRGAEPKANLRDFAVRAWSKSEGLPDASVTSIVQTGDGYLWVGTSAGLFRFDGLTFEDTLLPGVGTNKSIAITALCEDEDGNLWIGTQQQGVYRWQNDQGTHFTLSDGLLDTDVTSLALDKQGHIWIGTRHGANLYDGRHFTALTTADGLQNNGVLNIHAARSGAVWITTAAGTCRFLDGKLAQFHPGDLEGDQDFLQIYEDQRGNLWGLRSTYLINLADQKRINHFPGEKSAKTRIWNLCEGHDGRLWIGANGRGVFCFDGTKFQLVTLNEGRWPNDVRTIYEDREGNVWLGIADVGLVQLRSQTFGLLTENRGLPPGAATCITRDDSGRLYVGMESGGIYVSGPDHFEPLGVNDLFLGQEAVSSLCATAGDTLWAGTGGTGLYQVRNGLTINYTTADGLADDSIARTCVGLDGSVWVGTRFGAVQRISREGILTFTLAEGLAGAPVTAILASPAGDLWIGSRNGVLVHAQNGFANSAEVELSPRLAGKAILGLCQSTNHGLWIGTDGGGLAYVNQDVQRLWDNQDGLPDNVVWDMVEDDEANLWLVTPRGLCRITSDSIRQALSVSEPLQVKLVYETHQTLSKAMRFGGPHALQMPGGRLWFALNSSLVGVDIRDREIEEPPPQVNLESVMVNHKPVAFCASRTKPAAGNLHSYDVTLPSNPQSVEFHYAGLSFGAPEKVRYRHKLDGIDADWVQNGPERLTGYGPLPSGSYVFHVTACNADGAWNPYGATVAFLIPMPVWRTPWALGAGGVTVAVLGVGLVRLVSHRRLRWDLQRLEQQRAMERERMRIAQNMHDEIGSKLTKISYLSERANAELRGSGKAAGKIDSIAVTSRELLKALDEIVWAVNPQNDSLEHLAAYFCQYAREYFQDTAIECDLRMQHELPHVEMSAEIRHNLFLAFEEALNNVLKHSRATRMSANIATDGDYLRITIRDNGCGFEPAATPDGKATGGNGLGNIRRRLAAAGGTCEIESVPGSGTCISLSVPIYSAKIRNR